MGKNGDVCAWKQEIVFYSVTGCLISENTKKDTDWLCQIGTVTDMKFLQSFTFTAGRWVRKRVQVTAPLIFFYPYIWQHKLHRGLVLKCCFEHIAYWFAQVV